MTRSQQKNWQAQILGSLCSVLPGEWIVEDGHRDDPPDGLIRSAGGEVFGVELAGYRAQTPENERYERDYRLKEAYVERWTEDEVLQRFTFTWWYRSEPGSERPYPHVPRQSCHSAFFDDLRDLASKYGPKARGPETIVYLDHPAPDGTVIVERLGVRRVAASAGKLQEHCERISIRSASPPSPSASSSLSMGWLGLDEDEIRRTIRKHAGKLSNYRDSLPQGTPIWLVVHSDGFPASAHLVGPLLERAVRIARSCVKKTAFEAAFWLDTPTRLAGGRLFALDAAAERVVEGA